MIRIIVALMGALMLWMWFAAPFTKRVKSIITLTAMALSIALIGYETYDGKPRSGLINVADVQVCELSAQYSYRSDYEISLCLQNTASTTVKRVQFDITVSQCVTGDECTELETVTRDIPVSIDPGKRAQLIQTLRFDKLAALNALPEQLSWSGKVVQVKAVP